MSGSRIVGLAYFDNSQNHLLDVAGRMRLTTYSTRRRATLDQGLSFVTRIFYFFRGFTAPEHFSRQAPS